MGMKFRNRMKKILKEALVAGLLLVPAALPYTGAAEGSLPAEGTVGNEHPGNGNEGEDEGIMPCGDLMDEEENMIIYE